MDSNELEKHNKYLEYQNKRFKGSIALFHSRWKETKSQLKQQTELQDKISKLETDNMLLKMALSHSRDRCQMLINRYRKSAKYSKKLIEQSLEDLRLYDIENNS
jgi:predicted RNase H-like nuclease (RuvC/YqgF family)